MLTFSPLGEKVNTNMVLTHPPVKKSTLGKIVKNCRQFQVIDDESWFGPKVHCGDRMLGNLILRRIMRLKVERYEDNESRTYETLKEMVVTLIGADGDW